VLRSLGARYGFRAEKIDPVRYKEFVVSSTRIRRLVAEGRVDEAAALLGHHYFIDGRVVRGAGRGREIGFPDGEPRDGNEHLPPAGVYATLATIDGIVRPAVTNIGSRPTFGDGRTTIEAHVLGYDGDLYGTRCGWPSCSGCATSGPFPTSTRCASRSRPTAGARSGSSGGFRCRIPIWPHRPGARRRGSSCA
jgi:FAD synthase